MEKLKLACLLFLYFNITTKELNRQLLIMSLVLRNGFFMIFRLSKCFNFKNKTEITHDVIYVKCYANKTIVIYENVYETTFLRSKLTNDSFNIGVERDTRPNVLIIGISSLSRANIPKVFPKTYYYLKYKNWLDYRIFNRIGEETNLNLFALLTGDYYADFECGENFTLNSRFLWKDFQELGYITAYAKDSIDDGVSRKSSRGFKQAPTDFYFRSYIIASHMLKKVLVEDSVYCTGPTTTIERILDLARNFANFSLIKPSFGVFWMDSFQRKNTDSLDGLDVKLQEFFQYLYSSAILKNTIVMFLSDQGDDEGNNSLRGWFLKQIPFLFIWLPSAFKFKYPAKFRLIQENANSLTSPFDLYSTIQDLLAIYNKGYIAKRSNACPQCQSLLKKKYTVRSCKDASIEDNWCSCLGYKKLKFDDSILNRAQKFICTNLNRQMIRVINGSHTCQTIKPYKIKYAWLTENRTDLFAKNYLKLGIETYPSLHLNAILEVNFKNGMSSSFKLADKLEGVDWDFLALQCGRNPEDVMENFIG